MSNTSDTTCFLVRFWGVRGSYPTPGPRTIRYGGNTACVEVQVDKHLLILDAGTGIIGLGNELVRRSAGKDLHISLLITHGHGDHLLGIPFFTPLYQEGTTINIFGPYLAGENIEQVITQVMSPPYFPVDIRKLPSHRHFYTLNDREQIVWKYGNIAPIVTPVQEELKDIEVRVTATHTTSHPMDGAVVYSIEYAGRRLVFSTDVEWGEQYDLEFMTFVEGADLLIHDAQYTTDDYHQSKKGFGHSTLVMATEVANRAHVRELVLFHHDPTYDDDKLDKIEAEAQKRFANTHSAFEGMEINL